jgi:hypothetical protein
VNAGQAVDIGSLSCWAVTPNPVTAAVLKSERQRPKTELECLIVEVGEVLAATAGAHSEPVDLDMKMAWLSRTAVTAKLVLIAGVALPAATRSTRHRGDTLSATTAHRTKMRFERHAAPAPSAGSRRNA